MAETNPPFRPLPAITRDTEAFWTGGSRGKLLIQRCNACAYFIHPPTGFCPRCESRETDFRPVSGKGYVETFTVNHKQWIAGLPRRYVLALVRIAEQDDVRLATNIVNCDPDRVTFGMPVKVLFEENDDLWVPLFEPDESVT